MEVIINHQLHTTLYCTRRIAYWELKEMDNNLQKTFYMFIQNPQEFVLKGRMFSFVVENARSYYLGQCWLNTYAEIASLGHDQLLFSVCFSYSPSTTAWLITNWAPSLCVSCVNLQRFITTNFAQQFLVTFVRSTVTEIFWEKFTMVAFQHSRLRINDPSNCVAGHFLPENIKTKKILMSSYFLAWEPSICWVLKRPYSFVQCLARLNKLVTIGKASGQ